MNYISILKALCVRTEIHFFGRQSIVFIDSQRTPWAQENELPSRVPWILSSNSLVTAGLHLTKWELKEAAQWSAPHPPPLAGPVSTPYKESLTNRISRLREGRTFFCPLTDGHPQLAENWLTPTAGRSMCRQGEPCEEPYLPSNPEGSATEQRGAQLKRHVGPFPGPLMGSDTITSWALLHTIAGAQRSPWQIWICQAGLSWSMDFPGC
jgi:hypothetical protein